MTETRLVRVVGTCAVIGGSAWVGAVVTHAMQPRGCVREECLVRPQRDATPGTSLLALVAAVALVSFLVMLVVWLARSGDLGWTGTMGVAACVLGIASLFIMGLPPLRDQMRPLPSLLAVAFGLALVGWALLRSRVLPTWAGVCLLLGVLLLGGVSEQNSRVLWALPFGLAWTGTGIALVRRP